MPVVVVTQVQRILKCGQTCKHAACEGDFLQVWPEKWGKPRFWWPNLREICATELAAAGLAGKRGKKQPTRVWAGCLKKEGRNQSDLPK